MNNETYKTTFHSAVRELADLQDEKTKLEERQKYIDERIVKLRGTIQYLGDLLDDSTYQDLLGTRPELFSDILNPDKEAQGSLEGRTDGETS